MGTHISRIKSIDLDMWTPEQMEVPPPVHCSTCTVAHLLSVYPEMG